MPKISIRLDDAEAKRIDRVYKAIKKSSKGQNPSKASIVKRWIFMQLAETETAYEIPPPPKKMFGKFDISDLPETHQKVLLAVKELIAETKGQTSPTFDEIGARIGVTQAWAQRVCVDLKERGFIDWSAFKHRDLRIVGEVE